MCLVPHKNVNDNGQFHLYQWLIDKMHDHLFPTNILVSFFQPCLFQSICDQINILVFEIM